MIYSDKISSLLYLFNKSKKHYFLQIQTVLSARVCQSAISLMRPTSKLFPLRVRVDVGVAGDRFSDLLYRTVFQENQPWRKKKDKFVHQNKKKKAQQQQQMQY